MVPGPALACSSGTGLGSGLEVGASLQLSHAFDLDNIRPPDDFSSAKVANDLDWVFADMASVYLDQAASGYGHGLYLKRVPGSGSVDDALPPT